MLHAKNQRHRLPGSAIKVPGGGGVLLGPTCLLIRVKTTVGGASKENKCPNQDDLRWIFHLFDLLSSSAKIR